MADPASSAFGGTRDQSGWWHWIAGHIGGLLWPDADTGRLNRAGSAWITAGASVAVWTSAVDGAAAQVGVQRSPEVPDVVATCHDLKGHLTDLSDAYAQVGRTCQEYAKYVDDHHREVENELADFVKWTIGIEAGGAIIGILTRGAGEAAAQAAEAAEVASAASRVVRILQKLLGLARLCASKIGELVATITRISATAEEQPQCQGGRGAGTGGAVPGAGLPRIATARARAAGGQAHSGGHCQDLP